MTITKTPILQFGTSRLLQAHVDLFVDEALSEGTALGRIAIVQSTSSVRSASRIAAFRRTASYQVRIRGLDGGKIVDRVRRVTAIGAAYTATRDWEVIRTLAADQVRVIVSNTGDRGYRLDADDGAHLLDGEAVPASFPAELLVLLHGRYRNGGLPVTICPCESVANKGVVLRGVVTALARRWKLDGAFLDWLGSACIWVNSLVDRMVSEALRPIGAVAEPYAIWAVEAQPGMVLPCTHPCIVVTDNLEPYVRRKLFLLKLSYTFLAERWLAEGRPRDETVVHAMYDPALRGQIEAVWEEEVLPVFDALGDLTNSRAYLQQIRERFGNPFLAHRLADVAQNHAEKKRLRLAPLVTLGGRLLPHLGQQRLRATLEGRMR